MLYWLENHRSPIFRWLARGWRWYANGAGLTVLALAIAAWIAWLAYEDIPVFRHTTERDAELHTPVVKVGGQVRYSVYTEMTQSCPGNILVVLTRRTVASSPAVVTMRRPITRSDVGVVRKFDASVDLDDNVTPGKWDVTIAADTRCPYRHKVDHIWTFYGLEVTP